MKNFWLETPTVICVTILKYFGLKTATVGTLRACVRERIYIPLTLPLKECIQVRTKLSKGQLFTF